MSMRWSMNRLAAGAMCALMLAALPAPAGNDERYVSVLELPVHGQAGAFSPVAGTLAYGTPVTVLRRTTDGRRDKTGLPGWAEIDAGAIKGFVPDEALVTRRLLAQQSNVSEEEVAKAQRRFSEEEEGDLTAMKGMGGEAGSGAANFASVDAVVQRAAGLGDLRQRFAEFRKQGRTGEFKE